MKNNTERIMGKNSNKIIVSWFCAAFIVTIIVLVGYLCCSIKTFKASQAEIVNEHKDHIAKIDSIFYGMKAVILSNDSGTIANAPALLSQLQKDSALFRREILLSQEEMNNLVALHIDKIDNDYSQIGIWGGLLSIIFLIFGFFAIFKIEETKADAKNVLEDFKVQKDVATNEIEEWRNQASEISKSYNDISQNARSFITNEATEIEKLKKGISEIQTKSNKGLNEIMELLENVQNKNEQYKWSIDTMTDKMKQLDDLINILKGIIENGGKEAEHE